LPDTWARCAQEYKAELAADSEMPTGARTCASGVIESPQPEEGMLGVALRARGMAKQAQSRGQ
jgi:hypothetical protein